MALKLVRRGARAFESDENQYYRVLKGIDQDSVTLKLPAAGAFTVQDELGATLFMVSNASNTLGGGLGANLTLTPAAGTLAPWRMQTTGSDPTKAAEWIGPRTAMLRLLDFNEARNDSCAMQIQVIEDTGVYETTVRTGLDIQIYSGPDRGESSGLICVQCGGGGCGVFYKTHRLRPDGRPNLSYTVQTALELGTDDMAAALFLQPGLNYPTSPTRPDATLTAGILIGTAMVGAGTLSVSSLTDYPLPGGPVPRYGFSSPPGTLWPALLYVQIGSEFFSYTGKSAETGSGTLTGVTRAFNTAATAHAIGESVIWRTFNHASQTRLGTPGSKGHVVIPGDGLFDARPAYAVALNVPGAPVDASYTFRVDTNGNMPLVGAIASQSTITAVTSVSSSVVNATNYTGTALALTGAATVGHLVAGGSTASIAGGTGAGTSPPLLAISGKDSAGIISIQTGTAPAANAIVATVTFAAAFVAAPSTVVLAPYNAAAALLSGAAQVYVNGSENTTAHFVIRSQGTALTAGATYQWSYAVVG